MANTTFDAELRAMRTGRTPGSTDMDDGGVDFDLENADDEIDAGLRKMRQGVMPDTEDDDPIGILDRAYAYPATFIAGGLVDMAGQAGAGLSGLAAAADPNAPEGHAAKLTTDIAEWATENMTMPVLEAIGPDKAMHEAHENIGLVMNGFLNLAANATMMRLRPIVDAAKAMGTDTVELEGFIDAGARTAVVAAMFAIPFARKGAKRSKDGKGDSGVKDEHGFSTAEYETMLRTDVFHPEVLRLTYQHKEGSTVGRQGRPRAEGLLEDKSGGQPGYMFNDPMATPAKDSIIPSMPYEQFRQMINDHQQGRAEGKPVVYKDMHVEYSEYMAHIDELNVKAEIVARQHGLDLGTVTAEQILTHPTMGPKMAALVHQTMAKRLKATAEAVGDPLAEAAAAGEARLRSSALILQDDAFGMAMAKIVGMKNFEGMVTKLPERGKQELVGLLQQVGKRKSLGGKRYNMKDSLETLQEAAQRRFGEDSIYRVSGVQPKVAGGKLAGMRKREIEAKPTEYMQRGQLEFPQDYDPLGIDTRAMDLTFGEQMALHKELYTLKEGAQLPDGNIIFKDAGVEGSLAEQVTTRHGPEAGQNHKQVAVSERGEVYTPGQVQMLRALISETLGDKPMLSTYKYSALEEAKALVDFRVRAGLLGKEHRFGGKKLEDFGIYPRRMPGETAPKRMGEATTVTPGFSTIHTKGRAGTLQLERAAQRPERKTGAEYAAERQARAERMADVHEAYEKSGPGRRVKHTLDTRAANKARKADQARLRANDRKRAKQYKDKTAGVTAAHKKSGSASLDHLMKKLGIDRPLRKDIDAIKGERGGRKTIDLLRDVANELGVKKPGSSIQALRRSIKGHMADAGIWTYPKVEAPKGPMAGVFDSRKGKHDQPAPGKRKFIDLEEVESAISPEEAGTLNLADDLLWKEPEVWNEGAGIAQIKSNNARNRQRGAIIPDLGVMQMVDAVTRKWKGKMKEEAGGKPWQPEKRTIRQQADWGLGTGAKQLFGGQVMGPLFELVANHADKGKHAAGQLMSMIDQLPRHLWREDTGVVQSWYQVRQTHIGRMLTSETNPLSLQALLNKFEAKWFTGPRQYLGAVPGFKKLGLTMHRIKPTLNKETFHDLTSGGKPTTAMGKAFRKWYDDLYTYARTQGIDVAKYENHYYAPVFKYKKMMNPKSKLRQQFIEEARANGISENHIHEWMSAMIDGEGMVSMIPEASLDPNKIKTMTQDKNLELNRYFLKRFHPSALRPFLVDDVAAVAQKYATDMATRLADIERFGKNDTHWKRAIDAAAKEAEEIGVPMTTKHLEQLAMARQILAHQYGRGNAKFAEFQRLGIAVENFSKLGMVVPGSIAEPAIGMMNPTMYRHYAKAMVTAGLPQAARNIARAIYRDVGASRAEQIGMDTGRVASVAMHEHLTALNAADMGSTWSSLAFVVNLQHTMTNALLTTAAAGFEGSLFRVARKEGRIRLGRSKTNDFHKSDVQMIKQYGLDLDKTLKWMRDGARLDGAFYKTEVVPAVIKYQNDVVMTPRGVNLSPWMNKTNYAAIRHLMTYVTMFGNKVTPELAVGFKGTVLDGAPNTMMVRGRNRMAAAGTFASLYGLAYISEELMDLYKFGGSSEHPIASELDDEERVVERLLRYTNRTGLLGLSGARLLDILEASQYRSVQGKDVVDNFMGPLAGDLAEITALVIMGMQGEVSAKKVAKQLVSMMPENTMLPRTKDAPAADSIISREELIDGLEDWLIDAGLPRGGRRSSAWGAGYGS